LLKPNRSASFGAHAYGFYFYDLKLMHRAE